MNTTNPDEDAYQPKIWGKTKCIARQPAFEAHHIIVEPGGFCSAHTHAHKHNRFTVLSGSLDVIMGTYDWPVRDGGEKQFHETTRIRIAAGESYDVAPDRMHRFSSPNGCEAIEVYWPERANLGDIQRADEGGRYTPGLPLPRDFKNEGVCAK